MPKRHAHSPALLTVAVATAFNNPGHLLLAVVNCGHRIGFEGGLISRRLQTVPLCSNEETSVLPKSFAGCFDSLKQMFEEFDLSQPSNR
jgi:hypothetical protein